MADLLRSELLANVPHGFSTREALEAADIVAGGSLAMLDQVHSAEVVVMHSVSTERPRADAMVTDRPGLVLGIVTADCAPVLFADRERGVVAAAHAGWRGAHGGVLENTLDAMEKLGASRSRILAAIGPTIAQASYEVDEGFREQFGPDEERFFAAGRDGRYQFDLPAYVLHRISEAGVERIEDLALDTYANESRFYSYRRATHRAESSKGRQISAIALP